MPRDLRANWIFRIVPGGGERQYVAARRRALLVVSVFPVCATTAAALVWMWPWQPALEHVVALGLLGMIFVEIALSRTRRIPFTSA